VSALVQWWREIERGERTPNAPLDALWEAAAREAADDEFERDVLAPQRAYLAQLAEVPERPESESRAQWAVVMAWGDDDDDAS
jgi:hypothetical protein